MKTVHARLARRLLQKRLFCSSCLRNEIRDVAELPDKVVPVYKERRRTHDLLDLQWPSPPRNVLLTKKDRAPDVAEAILEFGTHLQTTYPSVSLIFEPRVAEEVHQWLPSPVYATSSQRSSGSSILHDKVDLVSTLGGDGTILRAAALFATSDTVPPILSFSMGTLGFLGEWKIQDYKRAFREAYMSGADRKYENSALSRQENGSDVPTTSSAGASTPVSSSQQAEWSNIRGRFMGRKSHRARVLLRNRLKVGVFAPDGQRVGIDTRAKSEEKDIFALNEVILHRGRDPHLAVVQVFVGGRFLTEAVADGMIVSTPTGSTAYSLSSGGSIVHPLVSSILLTPICPRSLSFRPLVLPANTPITLRLSENNRGREVEVSVDGARTSQGLGVGMELRVCGEEVERLDSGEWLGGVPSIVRNSSDSEVEGEDHWVGGLNSLLKFNYPFGE